jgi:hypothetical protein
MQYDGANESLKEKTVSQQEQPLDAAAIEENTETLTDLYLQADLKLAWLDDRWFESGGSQMLDTAIATLAKYGKLKTLPEIVEAESIDPTRTSNYNANLIATMAELHALWIDTAYFIARPDNLLNVAGRSEELTHAGREDRYQRAVAEIVVANGRLMRVDESYYGWTDWDGKKEKIVAAFDLDEDYWEEFNGTFASEIDSRSGFTLHVLYEDGIFRKLRYEAEIGEIMRQLREA